jgi:hypothetical protein
MAIPRQAPARATSLLVGGAVLAALVIPEFAAWAHAPGHFHHHGG